MSNKSHYFDHERLDVYQAALKFVVLTNEINSKHWIGKNRTTAAGTRTTFPSSFNAI